MKTDRFVLLCYSVGTSLPEIALSAWMSASSFAGSPQCAFPLTRNVGDVNVSFLARWQESLGHTQARCPVHTKPRIAVHHGIWRELLTAISRNSTETQDKGGEKWGFPSAVSEASHAEWTVH